MDLLYDAAVAWSKLLPFHYDIICGKSKKLYPISLDFKEDEFYHLAGFPHINDIVFPVQFSQCAMLRKVLDGTITEQMISKSKGYEKTAKSKLLAIFFSPIQKMQIKHTFLDPLSLWTTKILEEINPV